MSEFKRRVNAEFPTTTYRQLDKAATSIDTMQELIGRVTECRLNKRSTLPIELTMHEVLSDIIVHIAAASVALGGDL